MRTFVDRSVTRFDEVFASGGSEDTLLRIKVNELLRLGGCRRCMFRDDLSGAGWGFPV